MQSYRKRNDPACEEQGEEDCCELAVESAEHVLLALHQRDSWGRDSGFAIHESRITLSLIELLRITRRKLRKLIPNPPHRINVLRVLRVALDLGAQAVDVRIHGVIVAAVLITPHLIE